MANLYTGFHAVEERLRRYSAEKENGISLHIFYSKPGPRIKKIIALANSCGVENSVVSEKQLDTMAGRRVGHQIRRRTASERNRPGISPDQPEPFPVDQS